LLETWFTAQPKSTPANTVIGRSFPGNAMADLLVKLAMGNASEIEKWIINSVGIHQRFLTELLIGQVLEAHPKAKERVRLRKWLVSKKNSLA
jgi:hypothetical protein